MGANARALGAGAEFTFGDRTYVLSPWTRNIRAKFERYLEKEAVATVRRLQSLLTPDEFQKQLSTVLQDVTLGKYTFGTQAVADALNTLPHVQRLLLLMLEPEQPDISADTVEAMVRDKFDELMEAMTLANADPSKAPATTAATPGTTSPPPSAA